MNNNNNNNNNAETNSLNLRWSQRLIAHINPALTGDRLALPPSCLDQILQLAGPDAQLPSPFTFELTNHKTSSKTYGSVREFTATDGAIDVGKGIAETLGIVGSTVLPEPSPMEGVEGVEGVLSDGLADVPLLQEFLSVKLVTLPKGTYAKLAPLDVEYLDIADMRYHIFGPRVCTYTTRLMNQ